MVRRYVVKQGDTLSEISEEFYRSPDLDVPLAKYNGILDIDFLVPGQTIELPAKRNLVPPRRAYAPVAGAPPRPHGLDEVLAIFGNIYEFLEEDGSLDPGWESTQLARTPLPFSIPLSWDKNLVVRRLCCHKTLAELFSAVFCRIEREGLQEEVRTFGGCYNFRSKRSSRKLSTHCWAISVDLNPETNALGTPGDMHAELVEVFRGFGFEWGGDWSGRGKDPMHFQYCTGY